MAKQTFSILLVEDEAGFRRTYTDLFEFYGHKVLEACDGEEGIRLAKSEKPDLILLDLVMPSKDGFEVIKAIRSNDSTSKLPIIIFSVLGEQNHIQKGLKLGANDYIVKGASTPSEVLAKVGQFLAKAIVT